jgi:hypothetical protein
VGQGEDDYFSQIHVSTYQSSGQQKDCAGIRTATAASVAANRTTTPQKPCVANVPSLKFVSQFGIQQTCHVQDKNENLGFEPTTWLTEACISPLNRDSWANVSQGPNLEPHKLVVQKKK